MAGCRRCGCPTSRRLCRDCEIEQRAEERARESARRARRDEDDDDDEGEDPVPLPDGGWPDGDPCPDCGELMDVGAVGNPGETITWQECEDCGIGWGPFTGYVDTDDADDPSVATDGGVDQAVTQAELERRARQSATSLLAWCNRAGLDPAETLDDVADEMPSAGTEDDIRTDGSGHVCEACDERFETLTKLRLHEKDDCPARATYGEIDPDAPDTGGQAAEGLLTCRECGAANPHVDYGYTTDYDGEDFHYIVEFACRSCGFENENRLVMTSVDRADLANLPPHLKPDDIATDGGRIVHPADAALSHAGVADQDGAICPNGSAECAKPGTAPCFDCLTGGDDGA